MTTLRRSTLVLFLALLVVSCRSTTPAPKPATTTAATQVASFTRETIDGYPAAVIDNGVLRAVVFLPDAQQGYYRASRFDWSGMIRDVRFGDQTLFGPWTGKHNPLAHDHVQGPANEFSTVNPPGYNDAPVGGSFIKIGVGELRRTTTRPFFFPATYPIVRAGDWAVSGDHDTLNFAQDFSMPGGWAYRYEKDVDLIDARLVIRHRLTNAGTQTIKSDYYTHNFFRLNGQPLPLPFEFELPFEIKPNTPEKLLPYKVDGKKLLATTPPARGRASYSDFPVPPGSANEFTLRTAGLTVKVTCDHPASRFAYYGRIETACLEPFLDLTIQPGQTAAWTITYELSKP